MPLGVRRLRARVVHAMPLKKQHQHQILKKNMYLHDFQSPQVFKHAVLFYICIQMEKISTRNCMVLRKLSRLVNCHQVRDWKPKARYYNIML